MNKRVFIALLLTTVGAVAPADAQSHKPYRIGVIHEGGLYTATVGARQDR